jgi:group I intron endonuclease
MTEGNTFLNAILDDNHQVLGEVYVITNILNNKLYVGQTLTHRLNHGKYRPFGSVGRLKDHISEALCNSKTNQCRYLNNAIRKHGKDAFKVEIVERCLKDVLDDREKFHIQEYNCLYPQGYNLTKGGKAVWKVAFEDISDNTPSIKPPKNTKRLETTKTLISSRLRERFDKNPELKHQMMVRSKQQHETNKLPRFEGVTLEDNLDKYIHPVINQETQQVRFYKVKVGDVVTKFHGKHSSPDELKREALEFLTKIQKQNS